MPQPCVILADSDGPVEPMPLWVAPNEPLTQDKIRVELSSAHNRQPLPSDPSDDHILATWVRRLEALPQGGVLFNGTKFRLAGLATASSHPAISSTSTQHPPTALALRLGITDYRALCGTNFPATLPLDGDVANQRVVVADAEEAEQGGEGRPCGWTLSPYMANALGVEAAVITTDDHVLLFRRSAKVAENAGMYCTPGGHPEPGVVFGRSAGKQQLGQGGAATTLPELQRQFPRCAGTVRDASPGAPAFLRTQDTDFGEATSRGGGLIRAVEQQLYAPLCAVPSLDRTDIVCELYQSILDEVVEELGVPLASLRNEGLCAVTIALNNRGKPDLLFRVRVSLPASEVVAVHASGVAKESFESDGGLLALPLTEVRAGRLPAGLTIAPPSQGCLRYCLPPQ